MEEPKFTHTATITISAEELNRMLPGGWRPIESAPKDGTRILACDRYQDLFVAYWMNDRAWFRHSGWVYYTNDYEGSDGCMVFNIGECQPTHWMPLPSPPDLTPATGDPREV